ncbi:hypothetical protein [Larkinella soli]|uniref:hypothetical protein n=1 Tax=Larkinella soli TaxID=1770527 RepID=UPI000FFC96E9|nr:hypothetical protein [Larkinella soli]
MSTKTTTRKSIDLIRQVLFNSNNQPTELKLIVEKREPETEQVLEEVLRRIDYFNIRLNIKIENKINLHELVDYNLVGLISLQNNNLKKVLKAKKDESFNFNFNENYLEAWEYHKLLARINPKLVNDGIIKGQTRLKALKEKLEKEHKLAYIFGTGPSLEKAIHKNWNDGIRILSNTVVKDSELWNSIDPHFIVASDAIYHFGIGQFARCFRADLKKCMRNSDKAHFIYPAVFHPFCVQEFPDFVDRLIPIPHGNATTIHHDLTSEYVLPIYGNVLPQVLLPVACTLSKKIGLWGFDGRSPNDKMFWKNSSKHFYSEHVEELTRLHPAFFNVLLPKGSPEDYVKRVHGDVLERGLQLAEADGFTFSMLHPSYTSTLNNRYHGE